MLQAFGLSYEPSPLVGPLFQNLNISIAHHEKVALIGRNGSGKTKLLQILAGQLAPNSGSVVLRQGVRVAYLPQDFTLDFQGTLLSHLFMQSGPPGDLIARALELEEREDFGEAYAQVLEQLASTDAVAFEAKIKRLVARMSIRDEMLAQHVATLSLGERMRAALATLLIQEPHILLLDEPTNHLDIEARQWLEGALLNCPQAVLMVCHDRAMVDAIADRVLELERGQLTEYVGGYEDVLAEKATRTERQLQEYERDRSEQRRLKNAAEKSLQQAITVTRKPTQRTYDPKSNVFYAGKRKTVERRAKAMRTRVEQMQREPVQKPFIPDEIKLEFDARPLYASTALEVRRLSKSYGERNLLVDLTFALPKGGRIAVVGPNGCGKSTLFRILMGEEAADGGEFVWSPGVHVGFLSQSRSGLPAGQSIIKALSGGNPMIEQRARQLLGCLRLSGDDAEKPVGVLSVGERTKAELAGMLLSPANVLILDEPTNHLDIESLEALEVALTQYPGAVLFTCHDRWFVERVAQEVITLS